MIERWRRSGYINPAHPEWRLPMTTSFDPTPPSNGNARASGHWLWTCCIWVVIIAIPGYMIYSLATQTGLAGYLMALEIRIFGAASFKLTFMAGLLILILAASPFLWLGSKMLTALVGPGG